MDYLVAERRFYDHQVGPLGPLMDELRAEMVGRVPTGEQSARWSEGGAEYFTRTVPGAEFEQFCRVAEGSELVLLDENTLLGDSTYVSVGVRLVSPGGRYLAYSVDTEGDEVFQLRFRDLTTMTDLPDTVDHTYYGGAWAADAGSFFYVVHDEIYRPYQVWRHVLGTDAAADTLVYEELDPQYDVVVWADRAGDYLVVHTANRNTSEVHLIDARRPASPARCIARRRPGVEYSVGHLPGGDEGELLIVTNDGAQEFRLMRAPLADPSASQWVEVIPELDDERLHGVEVFARHIVLETVSRGRQLLRIVPRADLDSPDPLAHSVLVDAGVPGGLLTLWHNEEFDADTILVDVESYVEPTRVQSVVLATGKRTTVQRRTLPNYDSGDYTLEERWVTARDGEQVPLRLVRRTTTPLDGQAPLLLYGYGAESSVWPGFETWLPSLLDRGVVFVHAGIRGGAEMGRRWWLAGRLENKVNTFTDFIDVADSLAADGLIDGTRIVSRGLSAGGLLQGAVYSMRPDRWRAVVAEVAFVDVINSMLDVDLPLTANEHDEWGDPRIRDQFDSMIAYSPYDNLPTGPTPDLLVTGAFHDPRVLVHEPAKWVAALRATADDARGGVLLRVETGEGGHSGPTGRYAHLAYEAEVAAFILDAMGLGETSVSGP